MSAGLQQEKDARVNINIMEISECRYKHLVTIEKTCMTNMHRRKCMFTCFCVCMCAHVHVPHEMVTKNKAKIKNQTPCQNT